MSISMLQDWYFRECNGDWEHSYGIKIETLDNPGWMIVVDLNETAWEMLSVARVLYDRSDIDWVQYEISGSKFRGCCGASNLDELIKIFLDFVGF